MTDLPALVASWRTYRRMLADGCEPQTVYLRLVATYTFVLRWRLGL